MGIYQIAAIVLCGIVLSFIIKKDSPVISSCIILMLCVFIVIEVINGLSVIMGQISLLSHVIAIDGVYIKIIFKVLGIAYITQFTSDLCRDNGFSSAASQLEIMSRISIAALSVPIILALFETVNKCIN